MADALGRILPRELAEADDKLAESINSGHLPILRSKAH